METALIVLMWVGRALAGLELLTQTGWIPDGKAREIIGKIPALGRPIVEELQDLKADIEAMIARGNPTAEDLEALNARATDAEARLLGVLQSKGPAPA